MCNGKQIAKIKSYFFCTVICGNVYTSGGFVWCSGVVVTAFCPDSQDVGQTG